MPSLWGVFLSLADLNGICCLDLKIVQMLHIGVYIVEPLQWFAKDVSLTVVLSADAIYPDQKKQLYIEFWFQWQMECKIWFIIPLNLNVWKESKGNSLFDMGLPIVIFYWISSAWFILSYCECIHYSSYSLITSSTPGQKFQMMNLVK